MERYKRATSELYNVSPGASFITVSTIMKTHVRSYLYWAGIWIVINFLYANNTNYINSASTRTALGTVITWSY